MWVMLDMKEGEGEIRCRHIAYYSLKAPRAPSDLTSTSHERITIIKEICHFYKIIAKEFGIGVHFSDQKCTTFPTSLISDHIGLSNLLISLAYYYATNGRPP